MLFFCLLIFFAHTFAQAQGFINLNFENATITPDPSGPFYPYSVYASNAVPGWTAYINGNPQSDIQYNDLALGDAWVSIHDTNDSFGSYYGGVIQGRYTILLQPTFPTATISAAIGQTGTVPLAAESLQFDANGPISVFFSGQPIPLSVLGTGANYTIYGGDISTFAGQTGQLLFETNAITPSGWGTSLDNIIFSSNPVPEPGELALVALGALFFGLLCRKNSPQ